MVLITRREGIGLALGGVASLVTGGRTLATDGLASMPTQLITRAIPKTGELLPVIGLGSSATFSQVARTEDTDTLRDVLTTMVANGGTVFDTAPSYGASEEVAGRIARDTAIGDRLFWATKVNVAPRGGGQADPAAARAQIEQSFAHLGRPTIDLIQVHNVGDPPGHLAILKELKAAGRVRYIGITSTSEAQYPTLLSLMRDEPIDFIGVDYAVDNREAETTILPLAQEREIGVFIYAPFGRTRLFSRVGDRPLPDWASEIDAKTWAQVFLKWIVGHAAVTVVTPATSQAKNMLDNLGGGIGRVPDPALRQRIAEYIDALPQAS